jgi:hypothetical protein
VFHAANASSAFPAVFPIACDHGPVSDVGSAISVGGVTFTSDKPVKGVADSSRSGFPASSRSWLPASSRMYTAHAPGFATPVTCPLLRML